MDTEQTQKTTVAESTAGVKRTSINVREDLWADVRVTAIRRGLTYTDAVDEALRRWVEQSEKAA